VAEGVVAGPAPDERDGARELDRLVGVEVVTASPVSGSVVRESWPNQIDPSETTSWVTTPERSLRRSEMSRSARKWSLIGANCPTATLANAVYSPSVANIHG
jgi:hypothetical protein